eukprot:1622855-Pleurochrysis_carterae.AAC.5
MRHATSEGNRPSFWTYLKVNGCRGCQRQEEEEAIHHVLSGGCAGVGRCKNNRYRTEMKREENGPEAQRGGRISIKKQMISGIIPEWRDTDNKREKEL